MHKGYTYQIYNYGCLKKKLQEYNVAKNKIQGKVMFGKIEP